MQDDGQKDEVLARVSASVGRRYIGCASLMLLAGLMIYAAFFNPTDLGWKVFLLVVGAAAIWMAQAMWQSTAHWLELTETELRDSDGEVITRIDDIAGMDRGFFAFKPSNGFLLKLDKPGPRVWRPGMWWRIGKRVGIGGMSPGRHTKAMSEIIAIKLAQRDL